MNDLIDLHDKLQDTLAAIARMERELKPQQPDTVQLRLTLRSLEGRKRQLETAFLAASASQGLEVCSYRIVPDEERVKVAGIAAAIGEYQALVSIFYDAIKNGAKQIAKLNADAQQETAFDFAYAFAGSAGFVFTLPNEPTLFDNTNLDEAIRLIFEASSATQPAEILQLARRLGPAPIRVLYRWSNAHVRSSFSAEIKWKRGSETRQSALIQMPEFRRLRQVLDETSENTAEETTVAGELVGADVSRRSFHLRLDNGQDIRGSFAQVIGPAHPVKLPKRYRVTLLKQTRIRYSTEEPEVSYELLHLQPL